MAYRRRRPTLYDKTSWEARQSDIPSQHMAVGTPYSNEFQVDVASLGWDSILEGGGNDSTSQGGLAGAGGAPPPGGPGAGQSGASFVRNVFDSRPVFARDWASPTYPDSLTHSADPQGTFTVPNGYVGIVRGAVWVPQTQSVNVNQFGRPNGTLSGSIQVNNQGVPGFTFFDMQDFYPGGGEIECFILLNAGDVVTGHTFFQGTDISGILSQGFGGWKFWGNLLLNDGRDLPQYAGNKDCEPVCLDPATIAQIAPPPLVLPGTANTPPMVVSSGIPLAPCCPKPPAVSVNDYLACITSGQGRPC